MKFIFLILISFFSLMGYSQAYLDPGSGSFILSMLAIIIASIASFYNSLKLKIRNFLSKFKKKDDQKTN